MIAQQTGGLTVVRPLALSCARGHASLRLMSDLHLGSAQTDLVRIETELDGGSADSHRILLGGDVFDGILPGDKRYRPDNLHPRLRGRTDILNEAVDMAYEILLPYVNRIDAIGTGNHETAVEKKSNFDPVLALVKRLNGVKLGKPIGYLGYSGFVEYAIRDKPEGRKVARFVVWYNHGAGKTTTAPLALAKLQKAVGSYAADLYWSGHSHCRVACHETMIHAKRGRVVHQDAAFVVTGGYQQAFGNQSQASILTKGRKATYPTEAGLSPHGLGGARVILRWDEPGFPSEVKVEQ